MLLAAAVSAVHVLSVALAAASVWLRGNRLAQGDVAGALSADNAWGISALLMIGTGLWRAFGGLEKGTDFYVSSPLFHVKLGLVGLVLLLEVWPMVTLVRWRIAAVRGKTVEHRNTRAFAVISRVQLAVVVLLPFVASAMARGLWR